MTDAEVVRWYECSRKHRYDTFREADEAAWRVMVRTPMRNNGKTTNLGAYECEHCDGFHFGKMRSACGRQSWKRRLRAARHQLEHELAKV